MSMSAAVMSCSCVCRLTVFGDPDVFGLVFADAQQYHGRPEGVDYLALLQQVTHYRDFLPARTEQHGDGLQLNTETHLQLLVSGTVRMKRTNPSETNTSVGWMNSPLYWR